MIGLDYIFFFWLYFYLTVWAVRLVRKFVKNKKIFTSLAAAIWVLSVGAIFWDVIPVYVVHSQLCSKDAGFVVYKTLEQWKAENPGVAENLSPIKSNAEGSVGNLRFQLNQRFSFEYIQKRYWYVIDQTTSRIVDTKNGEVLAQHIDYFTNFGSEFYGPKSGLRDYKFWINIAESCEGGSERKEQMQFNSFKQSIDSIGRI